MDLRKIVEEVKEGKGPEFKQMEDAVLWYGNRLCVPNKKEIQELILREAHRSMYIVHPRSA